MASRGATATVTELPRNEFVERELNLRGVNYRIRELSAQQYDDCVRMATKADDEIDMVALLKLMVTKSLVEPKLTSDDLAALPYRVSRELGSAVNRLHFADEDDQGNE